MFLLQVFAFVGCVMAVPCLLYLAGVSVWIAELAPNDAPLGGGLFLVFLGLAVLTAGAATWLVMRQFRSRRRRR